MFLLDEAHLLHQDTLGHLHILLNYEWDKRALLSLILIGLPEMDRQLAIRLHLLAIDGGLLDDSAPCE